MVRFTDRPNMAIAIDRGHKTRCLDKESTRDLIGTFSFIQKENTVIGVYYMHNHLNKTIL